VNDQEKQIISDIFRRLEAAASQARDPEAERFIAEKVRQQPYAPYAMAQALYVQEEAMKSLNDQLEQLRAENEQLQSRASSGGGGILSSIFGGGSRPQPSFSRQGAAGYGQPQGAPQGGPWGGGAPQSGYPQQGGPWGGQQGGYAQQPAQAAAGGGGFLRGALTTAAGVAGGMVVGNALMNAFSGGGHQTLGNLTNADMSSLGGGAGGLFGGSEAGVQNASFADGGGVFQDAGYDTGGDADFGGGGDDSSWS
jgi:hypothetical protein